MMGPWGYVFLAYGIVWGVIVVYFILLKGRYRRAENELSRLRAGEDARIDGPK
jgi:CcmD family protein